MDSFVDERDRRILENDKYTLSGRSVYFNNKINNTASGRIENERFCHSLKITFSCARLFNTVSKSLSL